MSVDTVVANRIRHGVYQSASVPCLVALLVMLPRGLLGGSRPTNIIHRELPKGFNEAICLTSYDSNYGSV